jgi:hypothetical protein
VLLRKSVLQSIEPSPSQLASSALLGNVAAAILLQLSVQASAWFHLLFCVRFNVLLT